MSRFSKSLSVAALAAMLAPAAAFARSGDVGAQGPGQAPVTIAAPAQLHGRLAQNAPVPVTAIIAPAGAYAERNADFNHAG